MKVRVAAGTVGKTRKKYLVEYWGDRAETKIPEGNGGRIKIIEENEEKSNVVKYEERERKKVGKWQRRWTTTPGSAVTTNWGRGRD